MVGKTWGFQKTRILSSVPDTYLLGWLPITPRPLWATISSIKKINLRPTLPNLQGGWAPWSHGTWLNVSCSEDLQDAFLLSRAWNLSSHQPDLIWTGAGNWTLPERGKGHSLRFTWNGFPDSTLLLSITRCIMGGKLAELSEGSPAFCIKINTPTFILLETYLAEISAKVHKK